MEKRSIDEMQMQYNRDDDMPLEGERGSMIIVEENLRPEEYFVSDKKMKLMKRRVLSNTRL